MSERVTIPLLDKLIPGGVRVGSVFVVEYDAQSQWLSVAVTIVAGYVKSGGRAGYVSSTRPVDDVKRDLAALGLDPSSAQNSDRLTIDDWYSATLTGGRLESGGGHTEMFEPIQGGGRIRSLKVADLSVSWLKSQKEGWQPGDVVETWPPGVLVVSESASELLRFNEENVVAELFVTRINPHERSARRVFFCGFVRGIHGESFYKRMESAADGVIEIKVVEREDEIKNLLRVTSLKGQPHDSRWHEIQIKPSGEAMLGS
jgi:KaiC/GvpD/RAD55 family RecA-like ATPase